MRTVVAVAAIVLTIGLSSAAYGYADMYTWKLVWGGVETGSDLHIAGMYTTKEACVAEGRDLSRRRSRPGCDYGACHFYTYCITLESNPW
jgi:hypothetical protein